MDLFRLSYIGLSGIATGVYLAWAIYYFLTPSEGERYTKYVASTCLFFGLSSLFDIYASSNIAVGGSGGLHLLKMDYMIYAFTIPLWINLFVSIILPQKGNRWLMTRTVLVESVVLALTIAQAILDDRSTLYICWIYIIIVTVVMVIFCEIKMFKYEKSIKNVYSDTRGRSIWWLHIVIALFLLSIASNIYSALTVSFIFYYAAIIFSVACTTILIIILDRKSILSKHVMRNLPTDMEQLKADLEKSGQALKSENAMELVSAYSTIARKLKNVFEAKKMYLEADITSHEVANMIGTNDRYLSYFLNNVMGKSFHSYVRELRVEYAKNLISGKPEIQLADVAYKSGFNSPNTFSSAFKNVMAMSPRTFQKRCIEQKQDSKARTDENQQTQTTDSAAASAPKEKTENIDLEKMLNPREMRLCKLVMEEKTSQEIATELGISRESLRVTKSRLLRKLDPDNNHHDLHTLLTDRYTSPQP